LSRFKWEAHNPKYPLIVPKDELDVVGVVVGLIRKLGL
jgi:SOS-response transcriptional repressor LexA